MANFDEFTPEQLQDFLKSVGRDPESLQATQEAARESQFLSSSEAASKKQLGGQLKEALERAGLSPKKEVFPKQKVESIVESLAKPGKSAEEAAEVLARSPRSALESAGTFIESGLTQAEKEAASKMPVPVGKAFDPGAIKRDVAQRLLEQAAKGSKASGVLEAGGIGVPETITSKLPSVIGKAGELAEYEPRIIKDVASEIYKPKSLASKAAGLAGKALGPLSLAAGVAEPTEMYDIEKEAKRMPVTQGLKPGAKMYSEGGELFKEGEMPSGRAAGLGEYLYDKLLGSPKDKKEAKQTGIPQVPKELESVLGKRQTASEASDVDKLLAAGEPEEFKPSIAPKEAKEEGFKPSTPLEKEAEEKKSDLEKSLAEASKADLQERKKYSEIIKDAIQKRDMSQLIGQLGKAGALIGSGIGGTVERGTVTKPVGGEIFDKIIDLASQPISDAEKLRTIEKEESKSDPKSSDSIAARAVMTEFGIKVPETATAAFLEKQFPAISSLMTRRESIEQKKEAAKQRAEEMQLKREEIAATKEKTEESKINKDFTKMSEKLTSELASSRSSFGKSASITRSAEALETFVKNIDPKDITTRQIYEIARGLDAMLSQGAATISGTKKLIPETYSGDVAKIAEYITRQPKGAGQEAFIKQMMDTVSREKGTAQEQIKKTQGKILSGYKHLKQKDPERYEEILKEFGLSSSPEKQETKSKGTISKSTLEAYAKKHNMTLDKAKEFLSSQGYSHE